MKLNLDRFVFQKVDPDSDFLRDRTRFFQKDWIRFHTSCKVGSWFAFSIRSNPDPYNYKDFYVIERSLQNPNPYHYQQRTRLNQHFYEVESGSVFSERMDPDLHFSQRSDSVFLYKI